MLLTTTPQQFLSESLLLIRAHPATTKTTTTYASTSTLPSAPHPHPTTDKVTKRKPRRRVPSLTLKTYDPISGSVIVFKTDKIADVGRVVGALARVARSMGGLPDVEDQHREEDAPPRAEVTEAAPTPTAPAAATPTASAKSKKKRGKK